MRITSEPSSICTASLCLLFITGIAERVAAQDVQLQIERDVWIPLFRASDSFDAEAFLDVQSPELVRVSVDTKEVYGFDRYQKEIQEGFQRAKERGIARKSEARFLQRYATEDLAYETGIFRSEVTLASGEVRVRYSRFEFVLRREGGKWKILIDKDTADSGKLNEEAFRAAAPMRQPEATK